MRTGDVVGEDQHVLLGFMPEEEIDAFVLAQARD
ncbi:hypothetical protein PMI12_04783, partial [Variovorax sp. CF313]